MKKRGRRLTLENVGGVLHLEGVCVGGEEVDEERCLKVEEECVRRDGCRGTDYR